MSDEPTKDAREIALSTLSSIAEDEAVEPSIRVAAANSILDWLRIP
jgi:hypothetical protein